MNAIINGHIIFKEMIGIVFAVPENNNHQLIYAKYHQKNLISSYLNFILKTKFKLMQIIFNQFKNNIIKFKKINILIIKICSIILFYIFIFSTMFKWSNIFILKFADDWIRTADLRYQKQQLCKLSHDHFPP